MKLKRMYHVIASFLLVLALTVSTFAVTFADEAAEAESAAPVAVEETAEEIADETADETAEAPEEVSVQEEITDVVSNEAKNEGTETPYFGSISLNEYSSNYVEIEGYAYGQDAYVELYANNVLFRTCYYDYESENINISYYNDDFSAPGTYKITAKLFDANGVEVESTTIGTHTVTYPAVEYIESSGIETESYKDDKSGFRKYVGASLYAELSKYFDGSYTVYRSTSKNGKYTKIASGTVWNYDSIYFSDSSAASGKKYFYKIELSSKGNDFVGATKSSMSAAKEVTVADVKGTIYEITLNEKGKPVITYGGNYSSITSGYEIHRATKENGKYKKIAATSARSYVDTSAKTGKTYYYKVRPYNYNVDKKKVAFYGNFSEPSGVKVVMGRVHAEAKANSATSVKLTWDKVAGANGYEIYYKSDLAGDAYKLVTTTKKTAYTKKKLPKNSGANFQIRAFKNSGKKKTYFVYGSMYVNLGLTYPNITKTVKTSYSKGTLTISHVLKWDRIYGASGYKIYTYVNGNQKQLAKLGASKTSYTFKQTVTASKGADESNIYVVAYKGDEEREESVYCSPQLANTKGLTLKPSGTNGVKVSWKAVAGATRYSVYRYTPSGNSYFVGETTKTTLNDSGLTPGVEYAYTVQAANDNLGVYNHAYFYPKYSYYDDSKEEPTYKLITLKVPAPAISKVSNVKGKKAKLTWKVNANASQYVIYRSTSKKGTFKKVGTAKGNVGTFTDKKLKKGKTYYYKVQTVMKNKAGLDAKSAMGAAKSVKIKK